MKLEDAQIGILGVGSMGRALALGLCNAGIAPSKLMLCDKAQELASNTATELGARSVASSALLAENSDVVIIAVKPGDIEAALKSVSTTGPLWISIAAGLTISRLHNYLSKEARIIRAMPNTPALIGEGATSFVAGKETTESDKAIASTIFSSVGKVWEAPSETLLDAVTGLSGSGPAYIFVLIEALADAGVREGLPREAAQLLATQTVVGAGILARESDKSPADLKDQVSSPGGTTIAGLGALEAAGLRSAIYRAVRAATLRSKELAD